MRLSKSRTIWTAICVFALVLGCIGVARSSTPPDQFTIIALPDTQFYSESYPQIFTANMQWVVKNAAGMNIKYVAGLGDIVNDSMTSTEWQNADSAIRLLDQAGIPYGMVIGNHDYDNASGGMDDSKRSTTNFDHWFGPGRYSGYSWYGSGNYPAGSNANFYTVININGVNYMFLYLEFYPRNAALQWAAGVLQANPDKQVIVITHGYENSDNYRMGTCDISGPSTYNIPNDNDGDMMWSKLVSQYSNIIMVLSGHMTNAGHEVDFGVNGNLVNQMMSAHYNNGSTPDDGDGYLRILTITPSQNLISVQTYSPYANLYKRDSANQFSVTLQAPPAGTVAGQAQIRGRIRNTNCSGIIGATASFQSSTDSGSVPVNTSGYYTANVTSPGTYVVTAAASGYASASTTVQVRDGYAVPARFVLSTATADFTVTSTPASQSVTQGNAAAYTATITGGNGFAGTVTFAASGLPAGAAAMFTPTSIIGSGSTSMNITCSSTTVPGNYTVTITATSGSIQHTTTVALAVTGFSLSVSPKSQKVSGGSTALYTATVKDLNGYSATEAMSVTELPPGATATFNPSFISGSGTSTLKVQTAAATPKGKYSLTVQATSSGGLYHTSVVSLSF